MSAAPTQSQSEQSEDNEAATGANGSAIEVEPAVNARADLSTKRKTVLPKIAAGGYKLPPSSLLHRPDDQQAVNEQEVKTLAEVLTENALNLTCWER